MRRVVEDYGSGGRPSKGYLSLRKPNHLCDRRCRNDKKHDNATSHDVIVACATYTRNAAGPRSAGLDARSARRAPPSGWIMKAWQYPLTETFLISPDGWHTVRPAIRIERCGGH